MSTRIKTKSGVTIVLRNPAEKGKRFARQLKNGKVTETGKKLSKTDRAYRKGYLDSRKDESNCFNAQKKVVRKPRKTTKKK